MQLGTSQASEAAADPVLASGFEIVERSYATRASELDRLKSFREQLEERLKSAAMFLVETTRAHTRLAAAFETQNHIATLVSDHRVGASVPVWKPRLAGGSNFPMVVLIKPPRVLGQELLFFGGFSMMSSRGAEIAIECRFRSPNPGRPLPSE